MVFSKFLRTLEISVMGNQKVGYRYAIEKGYDYVILLHGDGQYGPEYLPDLMLSACTEKCHAVFASRMINKGDALKGGMPLYKWVGNQILTSIENMVLGLQLAEYHTGYRLYSTEALKRIPFEANTDEFHFDSQIIIQLRALNAKIAEVPIKTFYGDETCHVNGLKYARDVCLSLVDYRLHQLHLVRRPNYLVSQDEVYTRKHSPYGSHEQILSLIHKPGQALDLGCASGLLTRSLQERGVESVGVDREPASQITAPFKAYYQLSLEDQFRDLAVGSRSGFKYGREFDYLILGDVIEHLRNGKELLVFIRSFLRPDGSLIISTPNIANWYCRLSLLMGRFNYGPKGILDETHVKFYTLDTFRQLIESTGYKVTQERFTGLPFEVVFSSAGKSKLLRLLDWAYFQWVRFWPRLFAYQFVFEAKISNFAAVKDEGRIV